MSRRAPPGWTTKPCPGCSGTELRPKESVCPRCTHAIASWHRVSETSDLIRYKIGWAPHSHVLVGAPGVGETLYELAVMASPGDVAVPIAEQKMDGPNPWGYVMPMAGGMDTNWLALKPEMAALFDKAFRLTRAAVDAARAAGKQEGQNLLVQLNNGSLSMEQFEERKNR